MAKAALPSRQTRRVSGRSVLACALLAVGFSAGRESGAAEPPAREGAEAREQARLCERLNREEGAAACRAALALGIGAARRDAVRQMLARHLVALEKWDDLAEHYREDVRLEPKSADAWERLGRTLLFALDQRAQAIAALEQAVRLAPAAAEPRVTLGLALAAEKRHPEAVAALREALRLDPAVLTGRPAARAVLDAAERGQPWP